ncbi:hypothetical protein [Myroides indicus]|uniref:Uncharacterized protein n=1 Tax=Myroides indicus TaxID=1323422 RepID=A0A4R7F606_9FLAO|nr:hypothetical protein [Myroides indicus]TDS66143.1 hypothetical protein C8P70_10138 [Myroides indicus]
MTKIKASKVLYIRLGRDCVFANDCINVEQSIRLGYREVNHQFCLNRQWDKVEDYFVINEKKPKHVAVREKNQIKSFYEENENTLWITFYNDKLWWCFSKQQITLAADNTKTRSVIDKWSDKDINGNILFKENITDKLKKIGNYRGTIRDIEKVKEDVLYLINDEKMGNNNNLIENKMNIPLNQILFGAPGTGKTYNTKRIAVEIINGKKERRREEINAEYEDLVNTKQIFFYHFSSKFGV